MTVPADHPTNHPSAPEAVVAVIQKAMRGMDQKLGYHGSDRFVVFFYEHRGEEVIWQDTLSNGFATGAWDVFMEEVAPLGDLYNIDLGCDGERATHVLLIDRTERRAYFMERKRAKKFMAEVVAGKIVNLSEATSKTEQGNPVPQSVEITHESIEQLAREIWERKGRPVGEDLQDWLEAEAQLRSTRLASGQSK